MNSWIRVFRRGIRGYTNYNVNDIAKTLIELRDADLALRDKLVQSGQLFEGYHPEMEQMHLRNAGILNRLIDQIGFPTVD